MFKHLFTLLFLTVLVLLLGFPVFMVGAEDTPTDIQQELITLGFRVYRERVKAPDFSLMSLDGEAVSLGSLQGNYVFLNFWATWCPPCREEMPSMQNLHEELADLNFTILAVDLQEPERVVRSFIENGGFTFTVLLDSRGQVGAQYNARSIPTTYLIDDEGYAVGFLVGSRMWDLPEVYATFRKLID